MRAPPRWLRWTVVSVLVAFVAVSALYVIVKPRAATTTGAPAAQRASPAGIQTVVYYFYTSSRCASCLRIEAWTKECLQQEFAPELQTGRIAWRPVNLEEDGNVHFVQDFKLTAKTVIVCNYRDGEAGQFADLVDVWTLLTDKERFFQLVHTKVKEYLGRAA